MNTVRPVQPFRNKPFLAILANFSHIFSHRGLTFFQHYAKPDFSDNFEGSSIFIGNVVSPFQNKSFFSQLSHFLAILASGGRLDS